MTPLSELKKMKVAELRQRGHRLVDKLKKSQLINLLTSSLTPDNTSKRKAPPRSQPSRARKKPRVDLIEISGSEEEAAQEDEHSKKESWRYSLRAQPLKGKKKTRVLLEGLALDGKEHKLVVGSASVKVAA